MREITAATIRQRATIGKRAHESEEDQNEEKKIIIIDHVAIITNSLATPPSFYQLHMPTVSNSSTPHKEEHHENSIYY